ncbi:multifunctional 2',3'-cyclic-nucleotide 2'-phosphodiesterase/5'-nucleotidase/3'-nucleotidase [Rhodobacteraceae bacterium RKSG542]|uniref:bifunctional metallophosphatase/5'-nucleotidase n=1 Tax=Pseudovibrio flavus TaxID=2529854 RepID=UPI0012BC4A75|nr:5'-nucleotidase C-terminal domain-containing protein [Pseudovibrio flavus]MTI18855.1 multifunctional 2',3'-cyclic-nucleotide 2'-phosphodiesterase/5'-nucleotidase/3'-nucleotidase [Pseudovibrio flavus]
MTKVFANALCGVAVSALMAGAATPALADYELTILHTNDFHSRIEPINKYDSGCKEEDNAAGKCFGGSARLISAVKDRRAAHENSILVDGGDQFQGSLFYTYYKGQAAAEFMNAIGYDAMTVGNHEFDDGPEVLRGFMDTVDFPVLLANADVSKEPALAEVLKPAITLEIGGEKVGLIGLTPEDTHELASPGKNVTFSDPISAVKAQVEALTAEGVNKIVVLSHSGYEIDKGVAAAVGGIDVIVGGHTNTYLSNTSEKAKGPYPTWVDGPDGSKTAIVQAYAYGKFLGELNVKFDDNGDIIEAAGEPVIVDGTIAEDATIKARVAELAGPLEEIRQTVVGSSAAPIDGDRSNCRARECEMGNLVADAILSATKDQGVQIAIQNGGGLRASIDGGEVTMGEVLTVLPFQNTLATFDLEGRYIKEAIENGLSKLEDGAGRFAQVAGLKYSFDGSKPAGERVVALMLADGSAIEDDKVYKVATNNYVRSGGDGYKIFASKGMNAYDYGPGLENVVADYLAANGEYKPYLDGRITDATAK